MRANVRVHIIVRELEINLPARPIDGIEQLHVDYLESSLEIDIEGRMMMYKYGPWDPSHYEHAASLYASGLIFAERRGNGMWLTATEKGLGVAEFLEDHEDWLLVERRIRIVRDYLGGLSARRLTELISKASPRFRVTQMGEFI